MRAQSRKLQFLLAGIILVGMMGVAAFPLEAAPPPDLSNGLVPCGSASNPEPCSICHFGALAINITNFMMYYVALPATALLVAIGGIMLLIAGPSETLRTRGKEILKATIIGILIVFLAWLLVDTMIKIVTNDWSEGAGSLLMEQLGPWNKFDVEACKRIL